MDASRAYEAARAAWPGIAVSRELFTAALERLGDVPHASDVYLALGCAAGDAAAIAAFDREMTRVIERAVIASGATPAETAELVQIVRVRLLVGKDAEREPAIATFSGRSALASWIKVVATREAARLLAHDRREELAGDDVIADRLGDAADPRLEHLKRVYRDEFRLAFATAVEALGDRDRLLLRQHVIDGLGIDQLAPQYAVHRATVARWLAAAQRAVIEGTHGALIQRLRIGSDELESILRLIRSQLDVSLPAALRDAKPAR